MKRCLLIGLLVLSGPLSADERILDFVSQVEVSADEGLTVTEIIQVRAEGREIRRGIYRDFPTEYEDRYGNNVSVPLDIVSVTRDGKPEPYHTEYRSNGIRIYIGDENIFLDPGVYKYTLTYRTDRQIGFFDGFDELYWNVTGNGWAFPIERVVAVVKLPEPIPETELKLAAYTGRQGETGRDFQVTVPRPGVVRFMTTRPLGPSEGLTIAVGFPKGVVVEPGGAERARNFFIDNLGLLSGLAGLLAALVWYLYAWHRVGRDPEAGAIYPRYEAPEGYSPASLRYVWRMGFDNTCFAAALINLAVKRVLKLDKADDDYVVTQLQGQPESRTEQALARALFAEGETVRFEQKNHKHISTVIKKHEEALSKAYEGRCFNKNGSWLAVGILLSLAGFLGLVLLLPGEKKFIGLFFTVWLGIWSFAVMYLVLRAWRAWRDLSGIVDGLKASGSSLFALPFVVAEIAALVFFGFLAGWLPVIILVAILIINALFYQLLKAPTPDGRVLLDKIEGLRLYLGVAEKEDMERRHGSEPPRTLERFERLLPYAIALNTAETWAEKFTEEIRRAEQAGELQSRGWYAAAIDGGDGFSAHALARGLSSGLAGAIASSSAAPGSSSGSGGGGFSGGGGGGGGGGGW